MIVTRTSSERAMTIIRKRASEYAYSFVGRKNICAYCMDRATTIDHCVPASFVEGNIELIKRFRLVKVASCSDCNVRAGDGVDETFLRRRRRIAISVRKKHRKVLSTADWDDDEIKNLGRFLRDHVVSGQRHSYDILKRLAVLDSPLPPDGVPNNLFEKRSESDVLSVGGDDFYL